MKGKIFLCLIFSVLVFSEEEGQKKNTPCEAIDASQRNFFKKVEQGEGAREGNKSKEVAR